MRSLQSGRGRQEHATKKNRSNRGIVKRGMPRGKNRYEKHAAVSQSSANSRLDRAVKANRKWIAVGKLRASVSKGLEGHTRICSGIAVSPTDSVEVIDERSELCHFVSRDLEATRQNSRI